LIIGILNPFKWGCAIIGWGGDRGWRWGLTYHERNNANASQNKRAATQSTSLHELQHIFLPTRSQRPTLLQFIRKHTKN